MTESNTPEQQRPDLKVNPEHLKTAIPDIKALIAELREIDPASIQERGEDRFDVLEEKIVSQVCDLIGSDGAEYFGLCKGMLDTAPVHMMYEMPLYRVRAGYKQGIEQAVAKLRNVIEAVEEQIAVIEGYQEYRALDLFEKRSLHPGIRIATRERMKEGRYSLAVADACTFLETLVRQRSGKYNLSGPELIAHVFTLPTPMLTCNTLHSDSEILEQQGIMHLISGMLLSLRNPCGAERIGTDAEKALDCIAFLSFLAEIVEQARQA